MVPVKRVRDELVRLADRGSGVDDFAGAASRILRRAVAFDGVCIVTMDPATHVPTGEFVDDGLPLPARMHMAEIEDSGRDFNTFASLESSAAALSEATGGELDRSLRHRELKAPHGFGDELRAVLADDGGIWGGLTLLRRAEQPHFTPSEAATVTALSRALTDGLRRAVLAPDGPRGGDEDALTLREDGPPGVLLLGPDGEIAASDAAAERWLASLPERAPIQAVAARARRFATREGPPARARVRTTNGGWLTVRASALDGLTAVTLEPARTRDLAPLLADAYALTPRERAVTQLVAEGLPTSAIALRLDVSTWTVQDHLKAIFEKVGVTTRGELVARLFFEDRPPRLQLPDPWD